MEQHVFGMMLVVVLIVSPVLSQFVIIESAVEWADANTYCSETYGTTTATIKSDEDAETLLAMSQGIEYDIWVGLNDIASEGSWEWVSDFTCDGACKSLSWWDDNEPSVGSSHDCGIIQSDASSIDALLIDLRCYYTAYIACDTPSAAPTTATPTSVPTTIPSVSPTTGLPTTAAPTTMEPTKVPTMEPTVSPTVKPTAQPSAEPTKEPTRDCSVFHIDEFLMDCSDEFDSHGAYIDTLNSDVASIKDELSGNALDIDDLTETVSKLVNATTTTIASINAINAEIQVIMEQLDRMGDYP